MSVQDDVGYVKLVSRFIGVPVELYRNGAPLMGTFSATPQRGVSEGELVEEGGRSYRVSVFEAKSFPSGIMKVALFVPLPPAAIASGSCATVTELAWGGIALHVAARFTPLPARFADFRETLQWLSSGRVLVGSGSARAGSALPTHLAHGGSVTYMGHKWGVFSWEPAPGRRIYLLTR